MNFSVTPWFVKIWHAPDHFRLMDPLPPAHRRGILSCLLLIAICLLWPPAADVNPSSPTIDVPLTDNRADDLSAPASSTHQTPAISDNGIDHQWRSYRIASGQTMAQLFRDNNLPPADVYAMAQVEGKNKPLSNLQTGQTVRIRENANGVVTGLAIESDKDNGTTRFIRQPDGSFQVVH